MAKFSITVTRTDEYTIEVDENVWTPEGIKSWAKTFYPAETPEDIAKYLAGALMNEGSANGFMEGFGIIKTFRSNGVERMQLHNMKKVTENQYEKGLSATIITENEDYDFDIKELAVS